jgi:hypothetical protein
MRPRLKEQDIKLPFRALAPDLIFEQKMRKSTLCARFLAVCFAIALLLTSAAVILWTYTKGNVKWIPTHLRPFSVHLITNLTRINASFLIVLFYTHIAAVIYAFFLLLFTPCTHRRLVPLLFFFATALLCLIHILLGTASISALEPDFTNNGVNQTFLKDVWTHWPNTTRLAIQRAYACCGFTSPRDLPEPDDRWCPMDVVLDRPGCRDAMHRMEKQVDAWYLGAVFGMAAVELVMLAVLFWMYRLYAAWQQWDERRAALQELEGYRQWYMGDLDEDDLYTADPSAAEKQPLISPSSLAD